MSRDNNLCNSRHSYDVCPDRSKKANFRRCFIAWSRNGGVDSLKDLDAEASTLFQHECPPILRVCLAHVGKSRAKTLLVGADQCICALQIDVIAENNQASRCQLRPNSARS